MPEEVQLANHISIRDAGYDEYWLQDQSYQNPMIEPCEHCNPDGAEIPFEGSDSSVTDYGLETPAKCPNCRRDILEKTLLNLLKCASSSSACPLAST